MLRLGFSFLVFTLFFASALAQDKDAVTIKIASPQAGQRVKVTIDEKTNTKTVFTVAGKEQAKDEVKTKSLIYIDDVIENPKNERKANKLKRTFEKALLSKDGTEKTLPVEGKTVLIEKNDGKYSFKLDGPELDGESLKLLEDEFNKPDQKDSRDVMFPKKAVKPGETWKIDSDEILKAIGTGGPTFDKNKVAASGTLVKTYKKDGRQYGVIDFVFEAPITGFGENSPLTVKEGKMIMKLSGDGCTDGSTPTGTSTQKLTLDAVVNTQGIDLKVHVDGTESRTTQELPKK